MSFKTASAILRGTWLLDKGWTQAHLPLLVSVIKGNGSFQSMFGEEVSQDEKAIEPIKVLSHSAATVYGVTSYTDLSKLPNGSVAMIDISGPVTKYGDFCSWGSVDHTATVNRLANSPNVSGIILNIDSPGGQVSGTSMLADAIKAAGSRKPIIAVIDDGIAASAAMWIASAANEIYVTKKTDQVGSIGVYTTIADWYSYFESEGLKVKDVYAPQSTNKNGDYREALAGNEEPLKEDLAIIANEFISTVKTNRAGKLTSDEWSTGKMYYAKDAKKIGLIDGIKSFEQVVKRMDQIISQKQQQTNSYNMAFENTLKAANAESFEVVEGGFLLTEENLNAIEASIAAHEVNVATLNSTIAASNAQIEGLNATVVANNETITANNSRISELEAEVAQLKAGPAASLTSTTSEKDAIGAEGIIGSDPVNAEAARLRQMRNSK